MDDTQTYPSPPRLIPALVAGFDAIANRIFLILFPIGLDMILWFAPHLRIKKIIAVLISEMQIVAESAAPDLSEIFAASLEIWEQLAEQFNLLFYLRSYPVGVPSLMSSWLPLDTPLGTPVMIELPSFTAALILMFVIGVIGLAFGSLYYAAVSQVAVHDRVDFRDVFVKWPGVFLQVVLLTLVWLLLFIGLSVPASCFISLGTFMSGAALGQIGFLVFGALLIWLIFPLLFSPHGIFVNQQRVLLSIRQGIRITNATLPTTGVFVLMAFLLSQGLDMLWKVTPENSWLTLIGIAGHAFVTTGILAASFVYYRDADRWVESMAKQFASSSSSRDSAA